jgi:glucosamine--fructose-6-phosphate aminotransferase (isomerizing)
VTLWDEIQSQPDVLGHFIAEQWAEVASVAEWIQSETFTHVVMAARGSSDNAARYAQYLWGAHNGLNVALAAPSLYTLFESPPRLDGSLVVGISQSGQSPDLLAVLRSAEQQARPTLALTNDPASPMAELSDRHLYLAAGPELAIAATKSYTSELMALAAISAALTADPGHAGELQRVPEVVRETLRLDAQLAAAARSLQDQNRCVAVGRGYNHATAFEWALKIAELSYLVAQPFSAADFRHGPLALVEPGLVVLAVATDGPLYSDVVELIEVVRRGGAHVVAISDRDDCPADELVVLPGKLPEWLTPIPITVAAQLFTYHLTVARGLDPDDPRAIHKVTKTT